MNYVNFVRTAVGKMRLECLFATTVPTAPIQAEGKEPPVPMSVVGTISVFLVYTS